MKPSLEITVGARRSLLSQKQVEEVCGALLNFYPHLVFRPIYIDTLGDKDKKTSLRNLDKTDFFTKEIDALQLKGECRLAIHSAKDLPDPLAKGLVLAVLTQGVDPADVLVLREGEKGSPQIVATSSLRREESVKRLYPNVVCVDIRGTIQERLDQLHNGSIDGVVMAEAALIRLGLTHLNRVRLLGESAPLQGKLALIAREEDEEMRQLFNGLIL